MCNLLWLATVGALFLSRTVHRWSVLSCTFSNCLSHCPATGRMMTKFLAFETAKNWFFSIKSLISRKKTSERTFPALTRVFSISKLVRLRRTWPWEGVPVGLLNFCERRSHLSSYSCSLKRSASIQVHALVLNLSNLHVSRHCWKDGLRHFSLVDRNNSHHSPDRSLRSSNSVWLLTVNWTPAFSQTGLWYNDSSRVRGNSEFVHLFTTTGGLTLLVRPAEMLCSVAIKQSGFCWATGNLSFTVVVNGLFLTAAG